MTEEDINSFDENDVEDFDQFVEMYGFRERGSEEDYFDNAEDLTDDIF